MTSGAKVVLFSTVSVAWGFIVTINVALVTSDAVLLACDSLTSSHSFLVDPALLSPARDANGNPITDDSTGEPLFSLRGFEQSYVTDVYGGAQKMFLLHECEKNGVSVAAVTAGLAVLEGRPIHSVAADYCAHLNSLKQPPVNVEVIAKRFLDYVRKAYDETFAQSGLDEKFWPDVSFLVAGIGKNDKSGRIFRVSVKDRTVSEESGLSWAGQASSVVKLLMGCDSPVVAEFQQILDSHSSTLERTYEQAFRETLSGLAESGELNASSVDVDLPSVQKPVIPWKKFLADVSVFTMPIQYAVQFAAFLVNTESGLQRFTRGIATVGGRTHVGVIQKGSQFRMLNEQVLSHDHTGFRDDV